MRKHKAKQDKQVWSQGQLSTIAWLPSNLVPFPAMQQGPGDQDCQELCQDTASLFSLSGTR